MRLSSTRFDGRTHRLWADVKHTPEPWCFLILPNSPVLEGDGTQWCSPYPVVGIFWPNRYYQVFVLLKESGTTYYCNVISPLAYDARQQVVSFCDLDLDLIVDSQGVRVVDEEEFAERNSSYPREVVDAAVAAIEELRGLALDRKGPFSPATERRWRMFAQNG